MNSAEFGKVFSASVDGQIYAQPVYMSGLSIPGQGTHNVVFVVTENDSVYAFDADTGSLIWHDSFIEPLCGGQPPSRRARLPSGTPIRPEVGISSTPVIDSTTNTLYVVAYTQEVSGSTTSYVYRLHALDVTTGAEKFGGPVEIQAEDNGTGVGNDGDGHVFFSAYICRPARRVALAQRRRLRQLRVMGRHPALPRLVARLQRPDLAAVRRLRRHSQRQRGRHLDEPRGAGYRRDLHLL